MAGSIAAAPAARIRAEPVLTRAVIGITILNFVFFTGYLFFFPTLPFFVERLGGSSSEIGLLIGVSSLTSMLVRPLVGYLVDAAGRRPLLVAGLVSFGVTALLYNFALVPAAVFPLRVLTGASLATVVTAASTYLADVAPAHRRSEVMGYYGIANSLAFAVGPALGGYIIHAGALDGFNGMLLSHAGWSSGARTGELHFTTLFLVAAGLAFAAAAGAAALPVTGSRAAAGAPGTRPLAGRAAFFPAGVNAAGSFGFAALVAFLPLYARDHGTENPGVLFIAYAAGLITVRLVAGRWLERFPRGTVAAAGLFCAGAALVSIAGFPARTGLMAAAALYGMGAGLYQPALMAYLVDRIDPRARGRALGTFTLGADLGLSSGSFALGVVIDAGGFAPAFLLAACVATAGGVAIAVGARPRAAPAGT